MNPQLLLPLCSLPAAVVPRSWSEAMADRAADLACRLSPRARGIATRNLRLVTGRTPEGAQVRGAFRSYGRYYLGLMRLAHRDPRAAVGRVRWNGAEALEASLARGRGALVLSAHLGNWDLLGIGLAQRFGDVCVFAEALQPQALFRFYARVRRRHGVAVAPAGAPGRLPLEVLRRNGVLGMTVDRPFGVRREAVACGGGRLELPTGGIRLGLRAGAGIHAGFAVRVGDGYELRIGPDWSSMLAGAEAARVHGVAEFFAAALADAVASHPDQWCLLHPLQQDAEPAPAARGAA